MAWPRPGDPTKQRTTGTTGILKTHYDEYMWQDRILKEDVVHARIHNPDGFAMRNALRCGVPPPVPPQRSTARPGQGLDFAAMGWDPEGPRARELLHAKEQLEAVPRGRYALPLTSQHLKQWAVSTPSRPARSISLPAVGDTDTMVESSRALVQEAAEKRARRRDAKLASAEAGIAQALARSSQFLNKGERGHLWNRPLGQSDATEFGKYFVKSTGGIQLHQTRPSNVPVLTDRTGALVSPWSP